MTNPRFHPRVIMKNKFYLYILLVLCLLLLISLINEGGKNETSRPGRTGELDSSSQSSLVKKPKGTEDLSRLQNDLGQRGDSVLERGFHTIGSAAPETVIDKRTLGKTDEIYLINLRNNLPPIEITSIYEVDPDTGEREKVDEQIVYANMVTVRLRYGADPAPLYREAARMGARLYREATREGEEYLFSFPDVRINGFADAMMSLREADETIIRVMPAEVMDAGIVHQARQTIRN